MDKIAGELSGGAFEPADLDLMGGLFDAAAAMRRGRRNVIALALLAAVASGERSPDRLRAAIDDALAKDDAAEEHAALRRRGIFRNAA